MGRASFRLEANSASTQPGLQNTLRNLNMLFFDNCTTAPLRSPHYALDPALCLGGACSLRRATPRTPLSSCRPCGPRKNPRVKKKRSPQPCDNDIDMDMDISERHGTLSM